MSPDDRLRLRHMVEAIEAASRFIDGRNRADLDGDQMLLFALTRAVEIVGEAAAKVSGIGGFDEIRVSARTVVGGGEKILNRARVMEEEIGKRLAVLDVQVGRLRADGSTLTPALSR